jgi:F-type H+-transporting ATPase subunit gamma
MDTLLALDKRITASGKLLGIVKSLKTISAVNIRQYERAVSSLTTFVEVIELGLQTALTQTALPQQRPAPEQAARGLLVFGSDQGLCGRFNERLAEFVRQQAPAGQGPGSAAVKVAAVGARIASRLESAGLPIAERFQVPGSVTGINANVFQLLLSVEQWVQHEKIGRIDIFFNRYEKSAAPRPQQEFLLPINNEHLQALRRRKWPGRSLPCFRIPAPQLFSGLIRQYLFAHLFRVQAESLASEQISRLRSLQHAEKNIADHIDELRAAYRIKRQAAITAELLDLIAGFKATLRAEHGPAGAPESDGDTDPGERCAGTNA